MPVRLVLGAPAGTAPDTAARLLGGKLSAMWGHAVVIENRPGAGGTLAMEFVRAAQADGHTLMFAHSGAVVVTPRFLKAARYDPINQFTAIGLVADSPMVIAVGKNVAEKTLPDLLRFARAHPGRVVLGSTEQSSLPYLVGHAMAQATGTTYLHVPFNQPGQALQALVKGDVQYYVDGMAPLLPLIKAGRIRALATTSDRSLPGLDGIPMVKDTVPGFVAVGWFALLGPAGLPAGVLARINHDMNQVLALPEVAAKMQDVGLFPHPQTPAETLSFMKGEIARWDTVIRKAGIEPM